MLMRGTAAVAPVLVLVGFLNLANHAVVPMTVTIAILGVALLLYHVTIAVVRAASERQSGTVPALLPVLIIVLFGIACLPLLALAWGARATDLGEAWRARSDGVSRRSRLATWPTGRRSGSHGSIVKAPSERCPLSSRTIKQRKGNQPFALSMSSRDD